MVKTTFQGVERTLGHRESQLMLKWNQWAKPLQLQLQKSQRKVRFSVVWAIN